MNQRGFGGRSGPGEFSGECAVGIVQSFVLSFKMSVGCFEVKDSLLEKTGDDALELVKSGGVRNELGLFFKLRSEGFRDACGESSLAGSPRALPSGMSGVGCRNGDCLGGALRVGVGRGGPRSDPAWSGRRS